MIKGLSILLLFQCLGEIIHSYTETVLPGPIIGMLLLFIALCIKQRTPKDLQQTSQTLMGMMPLLFLPATVGLFFLSERFTSQWLAIAVALIGGTILSLVFNVVIMRAMVTTDDKTL